ncbi:hypothetical protein B1790_02465 [Mycobacterium sp. AT1]|nr:hypothetical protein B1790_02465 [Mycobacterium sp. AT1]
MTFHGVVAVQPRGIVALPADLRRRLHLDESGAQVEITEREDGVVELRPAPPVPADQRRLRQQREKESTFRHGDDWAYETAGPSATFNANSMAKDSTS